MATLDDEDQLLRSVALHNANHILLARQRAEEELVRTKEALRESQERLTAALGAAGTGTFRWNIPSNTVEWDGNLDRLFALDLAGHAQPLEMFLAAVHPDDRADVVARLQSSARTGADFDMEFRTLASDGRVRWIDGKAKAFCDDAGTPLYMTGACADATSRRQAAEALRESEERLRAVFNQAAVGIAVAALDGHFLEMNRKFTEILGYDADELRALTFASITHPDDLDETMAHVRELLAGTTLEYVAGEALPPQGRHAALEPDDGHAAQGRRRAAAAVHRRDRGHHRAQARRRRRSRRRRASSSCSTRPASWSPPTSISRRSSRRSPTRRPS